MPDSPTPHPTPAEPTAAPPCRVAVLVDLERGARAGGHVKAWERIAEAAARTTSSLDLTVYFQGRPAETVELAPHVRYRMLPPVLSSGRFRFLDVGADTTDLAPLNPRLVRPLAGTDVIHTTDALFAFTGSARLAARLWRRPLVTSLHTDALSYTRFYSERALRRLLGDGAIARFAIERLRLPARFERRMRCRFEAHLGRCAWVFGGAGDDAATLAPGRFSVLRRGLDRAVFRPERRDRAALDDRFGIPAERPVLMFAGRLDEGKGFATLVRATRRLLDAGVDVHLLAAGEGTEATRAETELGDRLTLAGQVDQPTLGWLYASAELFVFPSRIEVSSNVVGEAMASGLPVVVAPEGGGRMLWAAGEDGIVVDAQTPDAWAAAVEPLLADPDRRAALARAGLATVATRRPTWDDVLAQDLLPRWRQVAAAGETDVH